MSKTNGFINQLNSFVDKKIEKGSNGGLSTIKSNNIYFKRDGVIKMAVGVLEDQNGLAIPLIAFGAGDGFGNNRGYIQKGTNGLDMFYIGNLALSEVSGFSLRKDGIYTTHPITVEEGLAGEFVLDATNWNLKLEAVDLNDPNNPKSVAIVKECISSIYAETIRGTYISTYDWTGATGNHIYMVQNIIYFRGGTNTVYMTMGFQTDHNGYSTPMLCLGASSTGNNLGYISKDANGLNIFYIANKAAGEIAYISLQKDPALGVMNIYCSHALKLNVALGDTYIATASTWNNKTQYLNTSGNMGGNIVTGSDVQSALTNNARIKMTSDGYFIQYNSSNQSNGIYCDKTYSDLLLFYANTEIWGIHNGLDYIAMKSFGHTFLEFADADTTVRPYTTWNFSNATVTGLPAAKFA